MIRHTVARSDPDHYLVEIPVYNHQLPAVISTLNLIGVPAAGRSGGPGWSLDDGVISISGTHTAVEKAVKEIEFRLNGPKFENAFIISERHKKGALP